MLSRNDLPVQIERKRFLNVLGTTLIFASLALPFAAFSLAWVWQSWIVLLAGSSFTCLFVAFLLAGAGRMKRMEDLVNKTSMELSRANRKLEQAREEMEERVRERTIELARINAEFESRVGEHVRREEAMEESMRQKISILDSISDCLTYQDLEMRILWANRAASEFSGLSTDEMVGRCCYEVRQFQSHVCTDCPVIKSRETGRPQRGEITTPGGRVWIVRGYPARNEEGNTVAVVEVSRDITDQKRTEEMLRQSEEKYRLLAENLPGIVYTGFKDWSVEFIDNKIQAFTDYAMDEFNSSRIKWSDLVVPEDIQAVSRSFRSAKKTGEHFVREYRIKSRNGDTLWVQDRGLVVQKNGQTRATGVFFDITDRKRAEEALKESELTLSTILAASPIGIGLVQKGILGWANKAMYDILGYQDGALIGKEEAILYSRTAEHERVSRTVFAGIKEKGAGETEAQLMRKDGQPVICHLSASPLDPSDLNKGIIWVVSDITAHKILEEQLRQAQKMEAIGTLAGGIAHDFNNILGIIMGYTEMAMLEQQGGIPLDTKLKRVLDAARRAKDLIKQILEFSRRSELKKTPVQVGPLVKEALKLLRSSLPATIEIRQDISANGSSVLADPVQIHQVLMNLCTNAAHAMRGAPGILEVQVKGVDFGNEALTLHPDLRPGPYLMLAVRDTGHGIDRNALGKLFDPYFTTKKPGEGTGLGLAVVHGIIKGCSGVVTVESKPGEGSNFQLFFPRITEETSNRTDLKEYLPHGTERVLLVDDEVNLVEVIQAMLERLGYRVTAKTDAREAMELFRSKPDSFDLVVTDVTMPSMTGIELAGELLHIRQDLPILLCTGFSEEVSADDARAMGIREFLIKPVEIEDLARALRCALNGQIYPA